jgi:hypothetical protein
LWRVAIPAAAIGALFAWLSLRPQVNVAGEPVFYPLAMLYYGGASAVSVVLVLVAISLLALWVPQALRRRGRWTSNGLAALLAVAGGAMACWASLPQVIAPYRHLDRAELNGVTYQLGLRAEASPQRFWFVLCTCESLGLDCRCHDLAETTPEAVTAVPELVADPATGGLAVRVGGQTMVEYAP